MKKYLFLLITCLFLISCNKMNVQITEEKEPTVTFTIPSEETEIKESSAISIEEKNEDVPPVTKSFDFRSQKAKDYTEKFHSDGIGNRELKSLEIYPLTSFSQITDILTAEQISNITNIMISCDNLYSFDGIQHFTNVNILVLRNLKDTDDLAKLNQLNKIKTLYIENATTGFLSKLDELKPVPNFFITHSMIDNDSFTFPIGIKKIGFTYCYGDIIEVLHRLPVSVEDILIPLTEISTFDDVAFLLEYENLKRIGIKINESRDIDLVNSYNEIIQDKYIYYSYPLED